MGDEKYQEQPSVIDEGALVKWLDARAPKLGDYRVVSSVTHVRKYMLNSPWKPDVKRHLGIFPFRGKYGRFRDYKSGNNGSVIDLIMLIDNVSFDDARSEVVLVDDRRYDAPRALPEEGRVKERHLGSNIIQRWELKLPPGCTQLSSAHAGLDDHLGQAYRYVLSRGMDPDDFEVYYCAEDRKMSNGKTQRLRHRVILPFRDWNGELWYWTARSLSQYLQPRYLEPTQDEGAASKEEVLYAPSWDIHKGPVLVCEGPIDARSLWLCGFKAVATQGSNFYNQQRDTLKEFEIRPIFAFDRDAAGIKALLQAVESWKDPCYYVFPPENHDWNSAMTALGRDRLREHILEKVAYVDEKVIDMLQWSIDTTKRSEQWNASTSKKKDKTSSPRRKIS